MKLAQLATLMQGFDDKLNNITNLPDTLQNYHTTQNQSISALSRQLQSNFDETKQQQTGHEIKIETLRTDMNTRNDQQNLTLSALSTQQQQMLDDQVTLRSTVQDNHAMMMDEIQSKLDLTELTVLMRQSLTELQSLREHNHLLQSHLQQRQRVADALVYHMLKFQYHMDDDGIHSALAVAGAVPYGNTPLLSTGTPPPPGVSTTTNLTNSSTATSSTGPTFPSPGCSSQPTATVTPDLASSIRTGPPCPYAPGSNSPPNAMAQLHTATVTPHLASSTGPKFPYAPGSNSQPNAMPQLHTATATPHLVSSSTGPTLPSPSCSSQSNAMAPFHAPLFSPSQSPPLTTQHSQILFQGQASQPSAWTPQQAHFSTPVNIRQQPCNNDSSNSNPYMSRVHHAQ